MRIKRDKTKELYAFEVRKKYGLTDYQIQWAVQLKLVHTHTQLYPRVRYPYNVFFEVEEIEKNLDAIKKIPRERDPEFEDQKVRELLQSCTQPRKQKASSDR